MPRPFPDNLKALHTGVCESDSTLELYLRGGAKYFLTTADTDLIIPGYDQPFKANSVMRVGELDITLGQATNRVAVKIANPADLFSRMIAGSNKDLDSAEVVIRSFKRKERDSGVFAHGHFFSGVLANAEAAEVEVSKNVLQRFVTFDVIPPETAVGICLATTTLSPANFGKFPGVSVVSLPSSGGSGAIGDGTTSGGGGTMTGGGGTGFGFNDRKENLDVF
ncbi:MAG TPA: hypothetical protein VNI84_08705 [Pyrinomonadaceae bacterium]|nr:hypothetical protein [Pyrinomonadaceae bacterium]